MALFSARHLISRHLTDAAARRTILASHISGIGRRAIWMQKEGEGGGMETAGAKEEVEEVETHQDFMPKYKRVEGIPIAQQIEKEIKANPVMVYMKGLPQAPMCGFSARVVQILRHHGVEFEARNILESDELRQGIKSFSEWPTIPQVYINGEFVGGCDIMMKMHESGELEALLKETSDKQAA